MRRLPLFLALFAGAAAQYASVSPFWFPLCFVAAALWVAAEVLNERP